MFCKNCGSVLDDDALFCTNCGTTVTRPEDAPSAAVSDDEPPAENPQKKPNGKRIGIILGAVVLLAAAAAAIVFFLNGDARKYNAAVAALDRGEIVEARQLFEELGDYEDATEYADRLTSRVSGVSDRAYYLGMQLVDRFYSSSFRSGLESEIQRIVTDEIDGDWKKIPGGELSEQVEATAYIQGVLSEVDGIRGDGAKDEDFSNLVLAFFDVVFDNAWAHALGDPGDQCTTTFSLYLTLLGLSDDVDLSQSAVEAAKQLDEFIPLIYDDLQTMESLDDCLFVSVFGMMTIGNFSSD